MNLFPCYQKYYAGISPGFELNNLNWGGGRVSLGAVAVLGFKTGGGGGGLARVN